MEKNKHRIEKVFLEINTNSMRVANSLKNSATMFIKTEVLPLIEEELNRFILNENLVLQIDKLDLSIDDISFENDSVNSNELKEKIKNQLAKKIEQAKIQSETNQIKQSGFDQILSLSEKNTNTLIYFLTNGTLPWWAEKKDDLFTSQNLDLIINSKKFKNQFQNILDETIVQKRVINQFSNLQLAQILSALSDTKTPFRNNKIIDNLCLENNFQLKESFWTSVFQYLKNKKTIHLTSFYHLNLEKNTAWNLSFEEFISNLKTLIPLNETEILLAKEKVDSNLSTKEKSILPEENFFSDTNSTETDNRNFKNAYYVQNAGLIILHPFIKELFKNCDLINEGNSITNKELAAHILHYTATKKEQDYEHAMLFEKFLCGIPLGQSIQREISISDSHKKQVEEMLQSVLEHWSALKSTSTDLLRNEFLQREGKLDIQDSNPRIYIEKKTQDILLEKIPWNISVSKIPWIEKLIYTDW